MVAIDFVPLCMQNNIQQLLNHRFFTDGFLSDIVSIINRVIDNPTLLLQPHSEEEQYISSIKVQRDERTLNDLMQRDNMTFVSARKMYFDVLAE